MSAPLRLPQLRRPVGWRELDAAEVEARALAAFLCRHPTSSALGSLLSHEQAAPLFQTPLSLPEPSSEETLSASPEILFLPTLPSPLPQPQPRPDHAPHDLEWSNATKPIRASTSQAWLWVVALVLALVQALWLVAALLSQGPKVELTRPVDHGTKKSPKDSSESLMSEPWPSWMKPGDRTSSSQVRTEDLNARDPNAR